MKLALGRLIAGVLVATAGTAWGAQGDGPVTNAWPLTWSERFDLRFGGRADAPSSR